MGGCPQAAECAAAGARQDPDLFRPRRADVERWPAGGHTGARLADEAHCETRSGSAFGGVAQGGVGFRGAGDGGGATRIVPYTAALLEPEAPWVVAGVLGGVCMLWGEAGIGKSFVACSLAASVATGRPWLGRQTVEGPVVYIAGEGGLTTVARRLDAAVRVLHCCDPEDPPPPLWIVTPGPNLVAGAAELEALIL